MLGHENFIIWFAKIGKSEIVPIGEVCNILSLANIFQCRVGSLPMIYIPIGNFVQNNLYLESDP